LKHFPVYTSLEEGGFISICNEYVGNHELNQKDSKACESESNWAIYITTQP